MIVAICALAANAQEVMKVHLASGKVDYYEITAIDSVVITTLYDNDDYRGHEYVDLGLPSGLKWAACNIGASVPEEYGNFYGWGETEPRDIYTSTYNKYMESSIKLTKYNVNPAQGNVDNKTVLEPEDDVAHVKWGGRWRMATSSEAYELRIYCQWEETVLNGVNVTKVTGPNGNCIYLPHCGLAVGSDVWSLGEKGHYWTSSLCTANFDDDYCSFSNIFTVPYSVGNLRRGYGAAVRAVAE